MSAALFGEWSSHDDVKARFEATYAEAEVEWAGEIETLQVYGYDPVFGREPGTRARIRIHEFETGHGGRRPVRAIVALPRELHFERREIEGRRLGFRGRLVACDPWMRHLFVAEGELIR